ncbi:hypothetical protein PVAND_011122 [Polypedilum vanderplanki]|uniref:CULT domain-containing protein n=1 Tax=Polypedilum vanderplanki TaxID=319348 RepID=A0A9J6CIJ6_POLVA|nr:hypothetical protein PVAND_011122 [Polypedilum vanderplanki]
MKCLQLILFGILLSVKLTKLELRSEENTDTTPIEGYFLCKSCGTDTLIANLIINDRISEQAISISNFTIGEEKKKFIVVQELVNPLGLKFKLITTKKAHCAKNPNSIWYPGGSWFEGFSWKVCQCPSCKAHLGWMFERSEIVARSNPVLPSDKGFYGIILDSVISESYADSLLMLDRVLRH